MLELQHINKSYTTGEFTQHALDDISLAFRANEFVSILGASGSGKTTLLNIIGGLDRYDSGDLKIDGRSTKDYSDRDWDTYRNYSIGFVFQSYNLIGHQSVLNNVLLALKLGGLSKDEQEDKAIQALEKVGLKDHIHKKPNQLSGGQMQRVAIARALVNDPEIILADEPTGALDSKTSVAIMDLLKEVAADRLVIMVTHNPDLAEEYSNRIVRLTDGKITSDSRPYDISEAQQSGQAPAKKAGMSFWTAMALSFNNLWDKKARTLLTAFAGSIGIIGIALILALANGVSEYISQVQEDTLASYPITIRSEEMDLTSLFEMGESFSTEAQEAMEGNFDGLKLNTMQMEAENTLTEGVQANDLTAFKEFLENNDRAQSAIGKNGIDYKYNLKFSAYTEDSEGQWINTDTVAQDQDQPAFGASFAFADDEDETGEHFQEMLTDDNHAPSPLIKNNYDLVAGDWPSQANQVLLVTNPDYSLFPEDALSLGLMSQDQYDDIQSAVEVGEETIETPFTDDQVLNKTYHLLPTAYNYEQEDNDTFTLSEDEPSQDKVKDQGYEVEVVGIITPNNEQATSILRGPLVYTDQLTSELADLTDQSPVVSAQKDNPDTNVLTGTPFQAEGDEEKISQAQDYLKNLSDDEKVVAFFTYVADNEQNQAGADNEAASDDSQGAMLMGGQMPNPSADGDQDTSPIVGLFDQWVANDASDEDFLQVYDDALADFNYNDNLQTFGLVDYDHPEEINIYTDSFDQKDELNQLITDYNNEVDAEQQITYTDFVGLLTSSVASIINVITYVLVGFVSVSLIVSAIMIGIITYISVQERTKEIGVLRALGASKNNTTTMFIAENLLIGLTSGLVGIGVSYAIILIANYVIHNVFNWPDVSAYLSWPAVIALILLATVITVLGGLYPARSAAKKDPVTALRTE